MQTKKPLVSVIVPSYNYASFIYAALESIYYQTYDRLELIIIDDNSKDNSHEIINTLIKSQRYAERFEFTNYILHSQNFGAHNTINEGIRISNGEYVTILNADDLFEHNRIQELITHLTNSNSEFAFSKIKVIDKDNNDISSVNEQAANFIKVQEAIEHFPSVGWSFIPHNTAISTGNMLFKREIFNSLNGFRNLKYCHDWDFALRALLLTEPLYVTTTSYYYRLHGNNTFLSLNDVVDREVKTVLGNYFKICRGKKILNKKAPTPRNWSDFFSILKNSSMMKFWLYSKSLNNFILQLRQKAIDRKDLKFSR